VAGLVAEYAAFHGLIALLCVPLAVVQLRPLGLAAASGPLPARPLRLPGERRPGPRPRTVVVLEESGPVFRPPPVGDRPLLWKELYLGGGPLTPVLKDLMLPLLGLVLFPAVIAAGFLLLGALDRPAAAYHRLIAFVNPVVRGLGLFVAWAWCVVVGLRAATSVSKERDQRTLDGLFTLPLEREAILSEKWLGSVLRLRPLGYGAAAVWLLGLLSGAVHPLGFLMLFASCASLVCFLASLGVWVSQACRNTLWANFTMALMLLLVFGGSWLGLIYSQQPLLMEPASAEWKEAFTEVGLNPMRTWWFLGFSWEEFEHGAAGKDRAFQVTLLATLAGTAAYTALAWVFWLAASARFRGDLTRGA
jgi:ABC-type transport system involved in multi-copper enzyme maturation permease subunit